MQSSLQCSIKCHQSAISWLVMKVYAITQLVLKIGKDSWFLLQEAKTATIPSGNHSWNSFLCQNYWYSSIFMSFLYSALWLGNLSEVYLQQCNKRFCTLSDPLTSQIYCLEFLSQEGAIFAVPGRWGQNNWVGLNWKSRLFFKKKSRVSALIWVQLILIGHSYFMHFFWESFLLEEVVVVPHASIHLEVACVTFQGFSTFNRDSI